MDWSTEYMGLSSQFNFAMNTFPGPPLTSGPAAHHTDPSMGNWSSPLEQNQLFENGIAVDPAANATTTSMWDSSPFMGNSRPDQSALAAAATPHAATSVGYRDPSMESTSTFAASTISPTSITTHAAAATTMGAWAPSMVSSRESVNRWNQAIAPAKQGNSFPGSMWAPHPSVEFSPSRMADCHAAADRTVYGFVDLSNDLADAAAARGAGVPQPPLAQARPGTALYPGLMLRPRRVALRSQAVQAPESALGSRRVAAAARERGALRSPSQRAGGVESLGLAHV
ncbi:hypothetical protein N7470_002532 [Penicillium chermesinum]|nr:hypothetical protein N7470_002532 [Penicillium chermesinum]